MSSSFQGVENYAKEIADANYPQIRVLTAKEDYQQNPLENFKISPKWMICNLDNVASMSATAYFFAGKLHTELNVKIGVIISAINGS